MQLESVMSMMRYSPPNGTAGLARSRVKGHNRSPCPPASSTPMASFISDMADPRNARRSRRTFYQQNRSKTQHLRALVVCQLPMPRAYQELVHKPSKRGFWLKSYGVQS